MDPREDTPRGGGALAAVPDTTPGDAPATDPARPATGRPGGYRAWALAVAGLLLLPMAVVASLTLPAVGRSPAAAAAAARVVTAAGLEEEFGIRVNLVAVTADGGLVDLRFTVIDKEKAGHLLHDAAAMPELFVESSGALITAPHPMAHKVTVLDGASYFLLYPNSGGAIQSGTQVSVVIDDIRLTSLTAQS